MPIIDVLKKEEPKIEKSTFSWEPFFSSVCARFFFLVLMVFDGLWFFYLLFKLSFYGFIHLCLLASSPSIQEKLALNWISLKRSLICALSLFIALFSPAFGIMVGCTYFLMYDKKGIEEVVPSSLREQFKDLFAANNQGEL
jgi:hypothetical protein